MERWTDIKKPAGRKRDYDFRQFAPGDSTHVKTKEERSRILSAFKYWITNVMKKDGYATSLKVDETDPAGAGFRIWFLRPGMGSKDEV